jgi:DNA-directed RNA polymerase subunit RPC12/RpoP
MAMRIRETQSQFFGAPITRTHFHFARASAERRTGEYEELREMTQIVRCEGCDALVSTRKAVEGSSPWSYRCRRCAPASEPVEAEPGALLTDSNLDAPTHVCQACYDAARRNLEAEDRLFEPSDRVIATAVAGYTLPHVCADPEHCHCSAAHDAPMATIVTPAKPERAKLLTCERCGSKRSAKSMPYHLTLCRPPAIVTPASEPEPAAPAGREPFGMTRPEIQAELSAKPVPERAAVLQAELDRRAANKAARKGTSYTPPAKPRRAA